MPQSLRAHATGNKAMKDFIKKIISLFNRYALLVGAQKSDNLTGIFYRVHSTVSNESNLDISHSQLEKVSICISGSSNILKVNDAFISESTIYVSGSRNSIYIASGVKLRKSSIILRGENCKLFIGHNTTFGGIRIVNVGIDNEIHIGSDCLFSDHIELWASDTHPIYDHENQIINQEKPVFIGNNVWVGSRVTILKGVTIHDGSILGMGSVILNDVPAATVSAGYPNKTLKHNVHWKLNHE
jgi:acetyltransferase-like isoleucine patch superfamily enzyme